TDNRKPKQGDVIEQVEVTQPNGQVLRYIFPSKKPVHGVPKVGREIDPARLRFELQKWAAGKPRDRTVTLKVRRKDEKTGTGEGEPAILRVQWQDRDYTNNIPWKLTQEVPFEATAPQPISELGFAYQIRTQVASLDPDYFMLSPPEGKHAKHLVNVGAPPLKAGDIIKKIRFDYVNKDGYPEEGSWMELKADQWAYAYWAFEHSDVLKKITVQVNGSD